jgi:protein TonB
MKKHFLDYFGRISYIFTNIQKIPLVSPFNYQIMTATTFTSATTLSDLGAILSQARRRGLVGFFLSALLHLLIITVAMATLKMEYHPKKVMLQARAFELVKPLVETPFIPAVKEVSQNKQMHRTPASSAIPVTLPPQTTPPEAAAAKVLPTSGRDTPTEAAIQEGSMAAARHDSTPAQAAVTAPQKPDDRQGRDALNRYVSAIRSLIDRFKEYPESARQAQIEGTSIVVCTISANGTLDHVEIQRSSGCPILDYAALQAIKRVSRFPVEPPELQHKEVAIDVPIAFHFTPQ